MQRFSGTFILSPYATLGGEEVRKFLSVLNSLRQSIRFTVEFEDNKVLNFLDVTVDRKDK